MRTSSYTIYVDLPDDPESMLLVHGYTGAYDRVSREVAINLRSLEVKRPPRPLYGEWKDEVERLRPNRVAPNLDPRAVETLRQRGYLTDLTPEQEEKKFERIATRLHEVNVRQPPQYMFMPTYQCNLRCPYCFQDHMRTDPSFAHLLRFMTSATVDRIYAAFPAIEEAHGVEVGAKVSRKIGFFGGEPLLERCRPIVTYIIEKALALGPANFWAVTNGTELESYGDLLGPEGLSMLQITIDGPPDEHDKRRIYADGAGSFSRIAKNIDLALSKGVYISIRLNIDRDNIHQLPALAEVFSQQGWTSHPSFSAYTAPIRAENEKTDGARTFDTWELDQALTEMMEEHESLAFLQRPDDMIKFNSRQIFGSQQPVLPTFKESFCSAHTRMYIFDAFADIYACWEKTGDKRIRMGCVGPNGELEMNVVINQLWRSRTVASNPTCKKCRYALHCGGGCAVLAQGKTGRFHSNFCDGYASRFRANVAEAYREHVSGVEFHGGGVRVCDQ